MYAYRKPLASAFLAIVAILVGSCTPSQCIDTPLAPCEDEPSTPATVTVSPGTVTLASLTETRQLAATVATQGGVTLPSVQVNWSSSLSSVATVSTTGLVTAVGNGTAVITASTGSITGQATVTVAQVPATLAVTPDSVVLSGPGAMTSLSTSAADAGGSVIANPDLTWTSSDEAVATVTADGVVTAIAEGVAEIVARATAASTVTDRVVVRVYAALSVSTVPLSPGILAAAYADTLEANGGDGVYSWAITVGSLPSGLVLDGATGALSGTPDATGSSAFTVEATSGDGQIAVAPLTIEVFDELTVTTTGLPDGAVGVAYDATVQVGGGAAGVSYDWTVSVGVLPDGLNLEASTGTISGAPTTIGSSTFTLLVTSSFGESTTRELTIDVVDVLTITTASLPNGVVGVAYLESIQTAGGSGVLAWSVTAGSLPVGLLLGASTGAISGTPSAAATSTFTLDATDEIGQVASMQFMITIDPALVVTTSAVRNGMATVDYGAEVLAATGGDGVYTWALASGSGPLPAGLTLGTDGTIAGTPTTAGSSDFTVEVASGDGQVASQLLSMVIDPAAYLFLARCTDRLGADTACEVRFSGDTFNVDIGGDTLSMQPDTSIFVQIMPPDSVFRTFFPDVQGPAGFQGELVFDLIGQGGELCGGSAESFALVTVIPNSGCPGGGIVSSAQEAIHLVQDGGAIEFADGDHPAMRLIVPRSDLTMRPVSGASPVILAGTGDPVLYDGEAFSLLGSGDFVVQDLIFRSPGTGRGGTSSVTCSSSPMSIFLKWFASL